MNKIINTELPIIQTALRNVINWTASQTLMKNQFYSLTEIQGPRGNLKQTCSWPQCKLYIFSSEEKMLIKAYLLWHTGSKCRVILLQIERHGNKKWGLWMTTFYTLFSSRGGIYTLKKRELPQRQLYLEFHASSRRKENFLYIQAAKIKLETVGDRIFKNL